MSYLKIAWFEFRRRIRSKWFLIGTFGMPILILGISLVTGYLAGSGAGIDTKHFGLIDASGSYGLQLVQRLDERYADREAPPLDLALSQGSFEAVKGDFDSMVMDKSLDGYFVIPADFTIHPSVRLYARSSSNFRLTEVVENELQDILTHTKAAEMNLSSETVAALLRNVNSSQIISPP